MERRGEAVMERAKFHVAVSKRNYIIFSRALHGLLHTEGELCADREMKRS